MRSLALLLLFAFSLFVSATLLFWIEPMFAKMILPRFGGVPAVWNVCLAFYTARTTRRLHLRPRRHKAPRGAAASFPAYCASAAAGGGLFAHGSQERWIPAH